MDNFEKSKSHWYVLQVMSGQENRAMKAIQTQRELDAREGIDDGVDDIRIPIDKVQVAQTNAKGARSLSIASTTASNPWNAPFLMETFSPTL